MTDAPRKRPLFQFHLSTAIVLMFVASGVLWLNVRELPVSAGSGGLYAPRHGWPFAVRYTVFPLDSEEMTPEVEALIQYAIGGPWNWRNMALNAGCAAGILLGVATLLEWRIRRQARRP